MPEVLLKQVEAHEFVLDDGQIVKLTISISVTVLNEYHHIFNGMVKECDQALYEGELLGIQIPSIY